MENYCWDDTLMNISRLFFCFVILLTYPIECFVCREVLNNIFWKDNKVMIFIMIVYESSLIPQNTGWFRHVSVTVGLVMSTCLVSMSTDCLGIVLELNVSTSHFIFEDKSNNIYVFMISYICYRRILLI